MQPSRARLICRSHNPFSPSVALWQHFVPNRPFPHQYRNSSSTSAVAVQSQSTGNAVGPPSDEALGRSEPTATQNEDNSDNPAGNHLRDQVRQNLQENISITKKESALRQVRSTLKNNKSRQQFLLEATKAVHEGKDYEGIALQPLGGYKERGLPWAIKPSERNERAFDRLADEIAKFYAYAQPSRLEGLARRDLVEQVRNDVRQALPDHILEVFGSERTGLASAMSDLDLRLTKRRDTENSVDSKFPPSKEERYRMLNDLYVLRNFLLRKSHRRYHSPTIRRARYPLLSTVDRPSGLDVQIVLSNDTSASREIMKKYMEEYPELKALYSVVKATFDIRLLSDVFHGGFGSYPIFMMCVASLVFRRSKRKDTAGALMQFLIFWRDFPTDNTGISLDPPKFFYKSDEQIMTNKAKRKLEEGESQPLPRYMLTMRDPADQTNDLGRKGTCIKHVQATCADLASKLDHRMRPNTCYSLLAPLVGPLFSMDKQRRRRLRSKGESVSLSLANELGEKSQSALEEETQEQQQQQQQNNIAEESTEEDPSSSSSSTQRTNTQTPDGSIPVMPSIGPEHQAETTTTTISTISSTADTAADTAANADANPTPVIPPIDDDAAPPVKEQKEKDEENPSTTHPQYP